MKKILLVYSSFLILNSSFLHAAVNPAFEKELKEVKRAAEKVNLRDYDNAKKRYLDLIAKTTNRMELARAKVAYGKYELVCAQDGDSAKWTAYQRDAYLATEGESPFDRVGLLLGSVYKWDGPVAGVDIRAEMDRLFAADERFAQKYYFWLLAARPTVFDGADWELEVCEKALQHKWVRDQRWQFEDTKMRALCRLGRGAEAEKWCLDQLAAAKPEDKGARRAWLGRLAACYKRLGARYYDRPDAKLLAKRIAALEERVRENPDSRDLRRDLVDALMDAQDYAKAKSVLEDAVKLDKEGNPNDWEATKLGDAAYGLGNYEEAVKWYSIPKKLVVDNRQPPNANNRFTESLYATGRYEECLKSIDRLYNSWSFRDYNATARRVLKEKVEKVERVEKVEGIEKVEEVVKREGWIRVMCYNIRSGVGAETWNNAFLPGELRGLPRIARTIREAKADYVCLQEIDRLAERTGGVDQPKYLGEETGLRPYFQDKVKMGEGHYGLAQLARSEAKSLKMLKLPPGKDKGHGRICFICEYDDFILATSHLSGDAEAQAASAEMILGEFASPAKPVVFCGDLNALPDSPTIKKLQEGFVMVSDPSRNTCHALHPDQCLDYVFVDRSHADRVKCSGYTVGTSTASDHLPVWIDIML